MPPRYIINLKTYQNDGCSHEHLCVGILESRRDASEGLVSSDSEKKKELPKSDTVFSGFVPTMNNMGWMTSTLDPYALEFIDYVAQLKNPSVVEIGCAYVVSTLEMIKRGIPVAANDLDPRHLEILRDRIPKEKRHLLTILPGRFPDSVPVLPGTIDAILTCRVLHFFPPDVLTKALNVIFNWLVPGGKAFIVTDTPYLRNLSRFIGLYEQRVASGDPWPGFHANLHELAPEYAGKLPPTLHLLDERVLARVSTEIGFKVEKVQFIDRQDYPDTVRWDGRESVGTILVK